MTNRPSVLEVINNFQIVKIVYINAAYILANEPLDFITFIGRKKELMITLYTSLWYNLSKESKNLGFDRPKMFT